jgi:hypothetical protein
LRVVLGYGLTGSAGLRSCDAVRVSVVTAAARAAKDRTAIEEMLRYDSPAQLTARIATEDVEAGGAVIEAGRAVIVSIGAANRDPEVFEQPDEFRIDRPDPGRHLSFSLGIHHCLGASLARLESRIAIEELTRRYPALELAAPPTRRPLLVLRGFDGVPVRATQMPSQSAA